MGTQNCFYSSTLVTRRKTSFSVIVAVIRNIRHAWNRFRVLIGYPVTFSFVHPSRCNQVLFLVFQYSNKSSLLERRTKLPCNQEWMNSIRPDQAYQRDYSGILEQTEWRSQTLSDHPGRLRVATERKTTSYCVFLQCLSSNIYALDLT